MISLKRSMDRHAAHHRILVAAVDAYSALIEGIRTVVLPINGPPIPAQDEALRSMRRRLVPSCQVADLDQTRSVLDAELREFACRAIQNLEQKTSDVRAIVRVLADATQTITSHNERYSGRLRAFTSELESLQSIDDLPAIRRRLATHVREMKQCAASMADDGAGAIAALKKEVESYQKRLNLAEVAARTDALTGAANRRAMESQLQALIQAERTFSIVLFDLDHFAGVNARFGHLCGDVALKAFVRHLSQKVRPTDLVCRWGGDEFLVFFECPLGDAMPRARRIAESLSGRYMLEIEGRELGVDLSVSAGVAEHRPGETGEQLFARADALLFHRKAENSTT